MLKMKVVWKTCERELGGTKSATENNYKKFT